MKLQEAYITFHSYRFNVTSTIRDLKSLVEHPLYLSNDVTSISIDGFTDGSSRFFKRDICSLVEIHRDEIKLNN